MRNIVSVMLTLALIASFITAKGQVSGPTPTATGVNTNYTFNDGSLHLAVSWALTNGTLITSSLSGTLYTATVQWTSPGSSSIAFKSGAFTVSTLSVLACGFPTSYTVGGGGGYCSGGSGVNVTLSGSQTGVNYQRQLNGSNFGISVSGTGSGLSWSSVTTTGTYTVIASNATTGCPLTMSGSAVVSSNPTPGAPSVSNPSHRCGTGVVTMSGTTGTNGTTLRWYAASSGGSPLATNTTYAPKIYSSTPSTTYYVSSYNATTGCEGSRSGTVTATVDSTGTVTPGSTEAYGSYTGTLTLHGYTGSIVRWEQNINSAGWTTISNTASTQGVTPINTSSTAKTFQYRAILNNSCGATSPSTVATVILYPTPLIYASGSAPSGSLFMSYGDTLSFSMNSSYYSYQWTQDGTDISGATHSTYKTSLPGVFSIKVKGSSTASQATSSNVTVAAITSTNADSVNSVSVTRILKKGVQLNTSLFTLAQKDVAQTISYQDGLGRTIQTVAVNMSPGNGGDIIAPVGYAINGRIDSAFLPYVAASTGRFHKRAIRGDSTDSSFIPRLHAIGLDYRYTTSEQHAFYLGTAKVPLDSFPYARSIYNLDPTARVIEQGAPGSAWQPHPGTKHTMLSQMALNKSAFRVRYWKANGTTTANYPDKAVVVSISTDENGHWVRTYVDKRGLTVCKQVQTGTGSSTSYLETYYIYDVYGRLIYQVPPLAMSALGGGSSLNATTVPNLIYQYTYDSRGRVITKKDPAAAAQSIVYDQLDRPVLTQDGNLQGQNKWTFIKYDMLGRPVYRGLYSSSSSRSTLQSQFDTINYATNHWYETEAANATYQGYTNTVFPTSSLTVTSAAYYDHYDLDRNGAADYTYDSLHFAGQALVANKHTRGLATAGKKAIIDATGAVTSTWLVTVIFYDSMNRPIQIRSNNHLYTTVADKRTAVFDFSGKMLKQKTTQSSSGSVSVSVIDSTAYDGTGRVVNGYRKVGSGVMQELVKYSYNALGQLTGKELHKNGTGGYLQSVDYRYNIRGWLTSINNAQLTSDGGVTNDDTNDYFGMEMLYNTKTTGLNDKSGDKVNYNGNVSAMKWSGAATQRSYKYAYDNGNRLLGSSFQAYSGSAWTKEAGTLNENITYDDNGNILTLSRRRNKRGLSGTTVTSTPQVIDSLTYTYASGNRLSKVEDAGIDTVGFMNGAAVTTEYTYDTIGDITADKNKKIDSIKYNVLGKVQRVKFTNGTIITYTYDAAGTKLKVATKVGATTTTQDYVSEFCYAGGVLSFFTSPEGRVVKKGSAYEYQYAISDQQGNTRVVFSSATPTPKSDTATFETAAQTREASEFQNYPSGGLINGVNSHTGTKSQYLNGGYAGMIGVAKSYKVYPGDSVKIDAYGMYHNPGGSGNNLASFAAALLGAFSLPAPAGGETGTPSAGINTWGDIEAGGYDDGSPDHTDTKAFVNIVIFDENYNFLDVAYTQLVGSAGSFVHMAQSYKIKEAGYVFMYVSNENTTPIDVYFDDVKMTYKAGNIIQYNEYYPFGMTADSWVREGEQGNQYTYQGKEYDSLTKLHDFHARQYDAALGRWLATDPAGQYASPYVGMGNNPVNGTDPNGKSWKSFFSAIFSPLVVTLFDGGLNGNKAHRNKAWSDADPTKKGTWANNHLKITEGLIQTDHSKSFFGQAWELVSRSTWQSQQTAIGYFVAGVESISGNVKSVSYYGGATAVEAKGNIGGAFTLGSFIYGNEGLHADPGNDLFQHEYGHYLQSQAFGIFYLGHVAIPSLVDSYIEPGQHNSFNVEQDANIRAFKYFNTHEKNYNGWDFSSNNGHPIKGYDDTLPFTDPANQQALKSGHMGLHFEWYSYFSEPLFSGVW